MNCKRKTRGMCRKSCGWNVLPWRWKQSQKSAGFLRISDVFVLGLDSSLSSSLSLDVKRLRQGLPDPRCLLFSVKAERLWWWEPVYNMKESWCYLQILGAVVSFDSSVCREKQRTHTCAHTPWPSCVAQRPQCFSWKNSLRFGSVFFLCYFSFYLI